MRNFGATPFARRTTAFACLLLAVACQSITIHEVSPEARAIESRKTVLDGERVSVFTREILERRAISDYREDPVGAIRVLDAEMRETHSRPLAAAIAELAYLQKRRWTAVDFQALATAVRYSYAFLFDPRLEPQPSSFDARLRGMCDLYNAAVADWSRALGAAPVAQRRTIKLDWYVGSTVARVTRNEFDWKPEEFKSILVAADYEVEGLTPPAMRRGIGVACLANRAWDRSAALKSDADARYRYLPRTVSFPMTLVVRWPDDCSILDADQPEASIEVLNPLQTVTLSIGGRVVPLEVDYTTPIAVTIAKHRPPSGFGALLHADKYVKESGFIMLEPYDPDRIMVMFVHGLASGPDTWLPLYNQLLADETIRTRYQFAFWFYPTGQAALESAANLRTALVEAEAALSPSSRFKEHGVGVICAHSLGGVISSTLVTDSGHKLWDIVFKVPPEKLPADAEFLEDLKARLIFEHVPRIKRIIYFSTPHRGAPEASTGLMQWASGLIALPKALLSDEAKLNKYVHDDIKSKRYTVAQSLAPHNPVFVALADLPVTPGVIYHSIIGDKDEAGKKGGSDGLVPYWSSHLDGAASELIIKSGHSTEHKPQAARETKRILLLHLAEIDARKQP